MPTNPLVTSSRSLEPPVLQRPFRPIHYLGSKLRFVDRIRDLLDDLNPARERSWDLFAGSGTVASVLAEDRDVVVSDIQEYSRVLCSALLHPVTISAETVSAILNEPTLEAHRLRLRAIVEPLIVYEADCLRMAEAGDPEPLCEFVDHGSLLAYEQGGHELSPRLRVALESVADRVKQCVDTRRLLVTRYYGGIYFSFYQAVELDALLELVGRVDSSSRDVFLAAVLSTASDVVNTVGKQFAQPLRARSRTGEPKEHLVRKIIRDRAANVRDVYARWLDRYLSIPASGRHHVVLNGDYAELLKSFRADLGVIYADPPYTRDHYSRYYHVLETLCLRDNPRVSSTQTGGKTTMSRGVYREERHQSPFCIKRQAPGAFDRLFAGARRFEVPLVVSYSPYDAARGARPRLMTVDGITRLARQHYRRVEIVSAGEIAHNKLNLVERNVEISYDAEIFLICRP